MINSISDTPCELSVLLNLIAGKRVKCSELVENKGHLIDDEIIPFFNNISEINLKSLSEKDKNFLVFLNSVL